MNVKLAGNLRTKATARLLRTISLSAMHDGLVAMFVDRFELQDVMVKESKQDWIDRCLTFDEDSKNQEKCFLMHKDWQEVKRLAKLHNWQDLFIEDEKGGNNAW